MNLSKYTELTKVSFRESLVYRIDALTSVVSSALFLLLYYFVWSALASSGNLNSSLGNIMAYFVVGQVVSNAVFVNVETFMGHKIRKGTIVNELKRPIAIFSQAYFHELGNLSFNLIAKATPVLMLGIFFLQISLPSLTSLTMFLTSLFLAFNLVFLLSYSTSMLIFWTKVEWSIRGSRNHLQKIFSGTLFPLFLIPEKFKLVFDILPFQAMVDGPIQIFMGAGFDTAIGVILNQIAWIIVLLAVSHLSWKKAKKKLTVQGG